MRKLKKPTLKQLKINRYKTKRFIVRPYILSDFKTWQAAQLNMHPKQNEFDDEVIKPKEITQSAFRAKVKRANDLRKRNLIYFFGIFSRGDNSLVGELLISLPLRFNVQTARISYGVFNNHWRQGIALETVSKLIRYGIKDLHLNRLEAEIQLKNQASRKLATKLRMRFEGIRKEAVFFENKWHDHAVYAITASDLGYKNRKPLFR